MNRTRAAIVCFAFTALLTGPLTAPLAASPPVYRILETPRSPAEHHPTYGYYPGYAEPVRASAYSYGWFGVKPRRHWTRQFGYYRGYREWSAR